MILGDSESNGEMERKFVTVKPACNDHLRDKIHYLWSIQ